MRKLIPLMTCFAAALSASMVRGDEPLMPSSLTDASGRLRRLGQKARQFASFRCTLYVTSTNKASRRTTNPLGGKDVKPSTKVIVADVAYEKEYARYRSEQVGREGITNLLINDTGALMWNVVGLRIPDRPTLFPRKEFVDDGRLNGRGIGTAWFMADALDGYAETIEDFHVQTAPKSKSDLPGTAWFVLSPKASATGRIAKAMLARRGREKFSFFIGVSADTGLVVQVKIRSAREDVDQRAVEIKTDLDETDLFDIPADIRKIGAIDAKTQETVELD